MLRCSIAPIRWTTAVPSSPPERRRMLSYIFLLKISTKVPRLPYTKCRAGLRMPHWWPDCGRRMRHRCMSAYLPQTQKFLSARRACRFDKLFLAEMLFQLRAITSLKELSHPDGRWLQSRSVRELQASYLDATPRAATGTSRREPESSNHSALPSKPDLRRCGS